MGTTDTPTARWIETRDVVAVIELGEIRCQAHRLPVEACSLCNGHNYVTLRGGRVADRLEGGYFTTSETFVGNTPGGVARWSGGTGSNPVGLMEQKDSMRGETQDPAAQAFFVKAGGKDLPSAGYRVTYEQPVEPDELRLPRWAESEIDFDELSSDRHAAEAAGMSWNAWHYARRTPERFEAAEAVEKPAEAAYGVPVLAEWRKPRQRAWSRWSKDW